MTDVQDLRDRNDPFRARVAGAVRRMLIKLTARALWQLAGHKIDGVEEVVSAEPFGGIGFFARPPASGKPEAIAINLVEASAPVVIAVRDEKTRQAVAGELKEDETAAFNSLAILHFKQDGTIEARPVGGGGPALALALKSDIDNLRAYVVAQFATAGGHVHTLAVVGSSGSTTTIATVAAGGTPPTILPPAVVGTSTLKAR